MKKGGALAVFMVRDRPQILSTLFAPSAPVYSRQEAERRKMPRPLQRTCLEAGLKLDLNELMRKGCIVPGAYSSFSMRWRNHYWDEEIGSAEFTADLRYRHEGRLDIKMDDGQQTIFLVPRPRRFGGNQWYFVCPTMNRCCSVLWMPPGATRFCSRQAWGSRRVAYASQFLDADNRAHRGKAKIKRRLTGDLDPDEWELPPKPKWMRWRTYNRYEERFDRYEAILEDGIAWLMAKFLAK
jgi:hypothetical protein